jgi:endonuclease/exonuclease/phosphatase family metal-dependent hydrolase
MQRLQISPFLYNDQNPLRTSLFPAPTEFDDHHLSWAEISKFVRFPELSAVADEPPLRFWKILTDLGIINRSSAQKITSHEHDLALQFNSLPFLKVLWEASQTREGRLLCFKALQQAQGVSRFESSLCSVEVSARPPLRGSLPQAIAAWLTPGSIGSTLAELPEGERVRFWNERCCPQGLKHLHLSSASTAVATEELSLLTFNVWGVPGLTRRAVARFAEIGQKLATAGHDIVALQEMWDARSAKILETAKYRYHTTSPHFPGLQGRGGLVILSKHPIIEQHWHPYRHYGGVERLVEKGALLARIQLPSGRSVVIVNTHLVSPPERLSHLFLSADGVRDVRLRQIKELSAFIRQKTKPEDEVYVLGDFNAGENSPEYDLAHLEFGEDLFRCRLPRDPLLNTLPSEFQGMTYDPLRNREAYSNQRNRLDYIFAHGGDNQNRSLDVSLFGTNSEQPLSDHFGVTVRISRRVHAPLK